MPTIEAIIDRQIQRWEFEKSMRSGQPGADEGGPPLQPVFTVSRQRGSGGTLIGERLAERFHYTLLDRDVIDRICTSTGTLRRIVASLDEHSKPQVTSWIESVLGMAYVDHSDYARHLLETIRSVARLGGVVVVGRGANFIVGPELGFHCRVVAPKPVRVRNVMERNGRTEKDANREVETADRERAEFIRKLFHRDIDDPLGYDLVLNTAGLPVESATTLIAASAMEKFERLRQQRRAAPV
jgi:cytidylate kinase